MQNNPYESLFKPKFNIGEIVSIVVLIIGIISCIVALFIKSLYFLIPLGIGVICIGYFFIRKLIVSAPKKEKEYVQVCEKIVDDPMKVMSYCPSCNRKIRLANKKGEHGVKCPMCLNKYKVRIK